MMSLHCTPQADYLGGMSTHTEGKFLVGLATSSLEVKLEHSNSWNW